MPVRADFMRADEEIAHVLEVHSTIARIAAIEIRVTRLTPFTIWNTKFFNKFIF